MKKQWIGITIITSIIILISYISIDAGGGSSKKSSDSSSTATFATLDTYTSTNVDSSKKNYDLNLDGIITKEEYLSWFIKNDKDKNNEIMSISATKLGFVDCNPNNDSILTFDEYSGCFSSLDTDGDGVLKSNEIPIHLNVLKK